MHEYTLLIHIYISIGHPETSVFHVFNNKTYRKIQCKKIFYKKKTSVILNLHCFQYVECILYKNYIINYIKTFYFMMNSYHNS